jgi:hypothetical protein
MKNLFFAVAAILIILLFLKIFGGQISVSIDEQELVENIKQNFPATHTSMSILTIVFDNPDIQLESSESLVNMKLDIVVNFKTGSVESPPSEGKVKFSAKIGYNSNTKEIYLLRPKIIDIQWEKNLLALPKKKFRLLLTQMLKQVLTKQAVYTFQDPEAYKLDSSSKLKAYSIEQQQLLIKIAL